MSLYRRLRYQWLRLREMRGSPRSLALGCAVGVFMGIMPVLPLRTVLMLLIAVPARANLIAAFVFSNIVANPFILAVWYALALACGNVLVANAVTWDRVEAALDSVRGAAGFSERISSMADIGFDIVLVLLAGGFLIALPAGVATYLVALRYFTNRQQVSTAKKQE